MRVMQGKYAKKYLMFLVDLNRDNLLLWRQPRFSHSYPEQIVWPQQRTWQKIFPHVNVGTI